jgi:general stress protein 26
MHNESNYETQHLEGEKALTKLRALLKSFRTTMMVTTTGGTIHSRPMGVQGEAEDFVGTLWFFSDRNCRKTAEILRNPETSLIFQNDDEHAYLHLFGKAEMVDDREKMKELYTPYLKTWFPDGLEDPRMTLIRFEAERGEFWDSPGGMLQLLAAFTKAMVTGQRAQGGEMGEVRL